MMEMFEVQVVLALHVNRRSGVIDGMTVTVCICEIRGIRVVTLTSSRLEG